jgi:uncharacterized protein involved in exopolysaccharide biosynthesis
MSDLFPNRQPDQRSLPFTLRDLLAVVFRHQRVMGLCFGGVFLGVLVAAMLMPAKYQADTKLLVKRERVDPVVSSEASSQVLFRDTVSEEELNSEVELVLSEDVLRHVVLENGLNQKSALFNFWQNEETRTAKAIRALRSELRVDPVKKTNLIDVSYSSTDARQAAKVLSDLNKAYIQKHLAVHHPPGQLQFFEQETEQYKQSLEEAENKLKEFAGEQGGVAPTTMRDLSLQKLTEFNGSLQATRAQISETEKRIQDLQRQTQATPSRIATQVRRSDNPQVLQQLKGTLLNLELKRTELLTKYQPDYPLVQEVDKQIADTKTSLAKEEASPLHEETTDQNPTFEWVSGEMAKAKADLSGLQARATATQAIVDRYVSSSHQLEDKGILQQDLLRTIKANEENYLLYLKKREEARIAEALNQSNILNVAVAQEPVVPSLPSRSLLTVLLVALLLSTVSSFAVAFALDYLDQSFRTPAEVLSELSVPVLASVPRPLQPEVAAFAGTRTASGEESSPFTGTFSR